MEVLRRIGSRATFEVVPFETEESVKIRFPLLEFRSLVVNPLGRNTYPEKAMWAKHKVQLCGLLLKLASGDESYHSALEALVRGTMAREISSLERVVQDEQVPEEKKDAARQHFERRLRANMDRARRWCEATVASPSFATLRSFLTQVMGVDPLPASEVRRDGSRTEAHVVGLVNGQLPEGWRCVSQARLVAVDGQRCENIPALKGEADLLLVDPDGVVQALVEVKTAKGNALLALYEDVEKLTKLVRLVAGRRMTVSTGPDDEQQELDCSPQLKPIYMLGTTFSRDEMAALVRSAQTKLLAMELGRRLSHSADAWSSISIQELSRDSVVLQVSPETLPGLAKSVDAYFESLAACEIYMVST